MEEKNYTATVPENVKGSQIDASGVKDLPTVDAAVTLFTVAKARLLDINRWNDIAGEMLAKFALMDSAGFPVNGPAQEGFFIRINIPGPGTKSAHGFDWVQIEEVNAFESEEVQSVAMRVRPAKAPDSDENVPSHFYSETATSTFTVTREYKKVTAAIYDRNLEPNKESENLLDHVRNVVIGFVGENFFSKVQWELLADGLLN